MTLRASNVDGKTRERAPVADMVAEWLPLAYVISRGYFIPGGDRDDVRQEALIGLWVACRDWDPARGSFKPFAVMVIRRRLATAVKVATAGKHRCLTDAARTAVVDADVADAVDEIAAGHTTEDIVEARARLAATVAVVRDRLTEPERRAVVGLLDGRAYVEIGPKKRVDNALWRARRKLRIEVAA